MESFNNNEHRITFSSKNKSIEAQDMCIQNDMQTHKNVIDLIQELGFSRDMEQFHVIFLKRQKRKKSLIQFLFFVALVTLLVSMI
jgi:hypothetical protein